MTWQEGRDGTVVRYAERLLPPWWIWLIAVAAVGSLGIAYGAAYGSTWGWITFGPVLVVVAAALVGWAPVVRVDDAVLRAGRARLPLRYVGRVAALDRAAATAARGPQLDAAAYLCLRTWVTPLAVVVEVTDPSDPHPYWLVSTRRPAALVAAIDATRVPA